MGIFILMDKTMYISIPKLVKITDTLIENEQVSILAIVLLDVVKEAGV